MNSENRGANMPEHRNFPDNIKIDAPFSNVVIDDDHVYLSGLVAADVEEGLAVLGDIQAETEVVMKTINFLLGQVDLDMSDIVRCDVHLTDLNNMDAMNAVYGRYFKMGAYPARTTTQSEALFGGSRVEITCVARRRKN
jgi:2-iminobutanoate/2-iminopropanoate deaminase